MSYNPRLAAIAEFLLEHMVFEFECRCYDLFEDLLENIYRLDKKLHRSTILSHIYKTGRIILVRDYGTVIFFEISYKDAFNRFKETGKFQPAKEIHGGYPEYDLDPDIDPF